MPRRKKQVEERRTLLDHYRELVVMAAASGYDFWDRDHARCFIAGAMATLGLLKRAAKTQKADVYMAQFKALQEEVDTFLANEKELAASGLESLETRGVQ